MESFITFFADCIEILFTYPIPFPVNAAITTTAVSLATLFFVMQFFSELAAFRMDRIEEAIRLAMKVIVAKIILENSTVITEMIYEMFWGMSVDILTEQLRLLSQNFNSMTNIAPTDPGILGLNEIMSLFINVIPSVAITVVTLTSIFLTIAGLFFEVRIHQLVAPLALATLVNDTTRSTGISFIKSYSATCLQMTIIGVCVTTYATINAAMRVPINSLLNQTPFFMDAILGPVIHTVIPLLMFVLLSTAIKKSGDLTKRMFGV
jgi:hypothetical protein